DGLDLWYESPLLLSCGAQLIPKISFAFLLFALSSEIYPRHTSMMMAAEHYVFTGRDGDVVPRDVTHVRIDKSLTVIPRSAFFCRRNIVEVVFDVGVETVEECAVSWCRSLRRVIMPGVKIVSDNAFCGCEALTDVECGKLERIGLNAFGTCKSLRSINL
ncbi:hypothetical protein QTG54_014445, partial [Skeletonema marinoi]